MVDITEQSSESLAARIVAYRTLNIGKSEAVLAMQILHTRNENGDNFDYKTYIEEKINTISKPDIDQNQMSKIKTVIKNVRSGNF